MYGSLGGVTAIVPAVGVFSISSIPTDAQVTAWLTEASVQVDSALASAGYSTPVDVTAAITPALQAMTQLYAAANVLQARGLDSVSGGTENRSDDMFKRFYAQLKMLSGDNLELLGVTVQASPSPRRRRIRTIQTRRIDGYSATYEGSTVPYAYPSE